MRSSLIGSMVCFIGLVVLLSSQAAPVKAPPTPKRILVLYWYNKDFPSNAGFDRSFQAVLQSAPAGSIEYYSEYLESDRFPGENQSKALRDYLRQKYASRAIDVVVAVSDVPLEFLLKYRDSLFTQTPIVFTAIRPPATNEPSGPGLTGIVLGGGYKKTLDLALRLHPGTKQVFIISGTLNHDKKYETLCREDLQGLDSGISINYFTDLSVDELIFETKRLPERSLVLYIWQQSQNEHGQLLESADVLAAIAHSTTAPIYGVAEWQLGRGVVGGYLRSKEADGTRAGAIALQITNGARAQDIPIERAKTAPVFDWGELHRWGLKESSLPPGSLVLNRQPTVWESFRWYILGGSALILLEALLISALVWQRTTRRRVEIELGITYDRLRLAMVSGKSVAWDLDVKTGHDHWLGDLQTMFGIQSDTYTGDVADFYRRVHPEDRQLVAEAVADAKQTRNTYRAEFRVV
ncbi:MAG TPA: PAS domain-containing protein, partial [Terriglobales bacterium]|nr:PAS domain-containing protein [Terriglobales bacterium]